MTQTPSTPSSLSKIIQATIQIPDERDLYNKTSQITHPEQRLLPGQNLDISDSSKAILLSPGERRQIWASIENGSESAEYHVEIAGDVCKWCINLDENRRITQTIGAHNTSRININFQIPIDFFENPDVINKKNQNLQLNYEGEIFVYVQGRSEPIRYQHFYIFVRPKNSYLNLLPEIYQRSDFINRLISIFEQSFEPSVQTFDSLWAYLDPLTAPSSFLPFLAKWVAWELNDRWDEKQQRRLIRNAVELYRWRGSKRGLRLYLHVFTGLPLDEDLPEGQKHINIEESFQTGLVLGKASFSKNPKLGGGKPFHFKVTLRPDETNQINEALTQEDIKEVIEIAKPAFCTYDLIISQPI
ncbi:MAG: phage tail protein [Scytonematopsis contorta HA4267-MV1]|jgi:phage tail-like protein|nr:phage tail protein [Scytonematopsis contorta HA4267-MV1]